ncbi:hypothetical protein [Sorangium sp. So ce406]|uniref:hypothetical protein n=1 Tax=Sorangium sp. So ce406 TaxID=3133311 RepID=UPI003F5C6997
MIALRSSIVARRGGGSIGSGSVTTRGGSRSGTRPGRRSIAAAPFPFAPPGRTLFFSETGLSLARCGLSLARCGLSLARCGLSLARCGLSLVRRGRSASTGAACSPPPLSFSRSLSFGSSADLSFFFLRSFVGSAAGAATARSERAATFLRRSLGFATLTRASLGFVALARTTRFFAAARVAFFAFAVALVFVALGFAALPRVTLAFATLVLAVFARVALAFVALAFAALALTLVALAFARALVVLSLAAARVDLAFVLAAVFLAFAAPARLAAARVAFFAFAAAGFFLAVVRVARAGVRVALRRAGAADLRVVARFVVAFRRLAAFTAEVRRAAGREAAAFRFGLRAVERAAGFAFRVRAVEADRLELAALALVALFRSFFEVFRVFFAAMGVLSHNRSGCPLPRCGELTYDPKGPNAGPQPSNLRIYPSTSPVRKSAESDFPGAGSTLIQLARAAGLRPRRRRAAGQPCGREGGFRPGSRGAALSCRR